MPLSFLWVGIAFEEVGKAVGPEDAAKWTEIINVGVAKDVARFEAAGCQLDFVGYNSSETMERLEKMLREGQYDGVCIGWGIRKTVEMTPFYESLLNTIHFTLPQAKMLCNTAPDTTFEAAQRQFPGIVLPTKEEK